MGCGCSKKQRGQREPVRTGSTSPEARHTALLVCLTCKHGGGGARTCGVNGEPLVVLTLSLKCPMGKHPDTRGRLKRLGIWWRGIPRPRQWFLPRGRHEKQCGCIDRLKSWVEWARAL